MMMIVVFVILTIIGSGAGFAVGSLDSQGTEKAHPDEASDVSNLSGESTPSDGSTLQSPTADTKNESSEKAPEDSLPEKVQWQDFKIAKLPPIVTALAQPSGRWIRLEGSILVRPNTEQPAEQLAEQAGEQILAYLRTVELDHITGPSGFVSLRDDLNETVSALSSGEIEQVMIHGLVVE